MVTYRDSCLSAEQKIYHKKRATRSRKGRPSFSGEESSEDVYFVTWRRSLIVTSPRAKTTLGLDCQLPICVLQVHQRSSSRPEETGLNQ